VNEKCSAKPTGDESTLQYEEKILYEHESSEAWFLGYDLLKIK
jgi:hypothetical protein